MKRKTKVFEKSSEVWHNLFHPYSYPSVKKFCSLHCPKIGFPDSRRKECSECGFLKILLDEGWVL